MADPAGDGLPRGGDRSYWHPLREAIPGLAADLATGFRAMSTDAPPPLPTPTRSSGETPRAADRLSPPGRLPASDPGSLDAGSPPVAVTPTSPRSRRLRQTVSIALILSGFAPLIVTLRAQNIGLASTAGASLTQLTTGIVGTVLLVTGLALIVQAFEDSEEPPVAG